MILIKNPNVDCFHYLYTNTRLQRDEEFAIK
jgi:hypothetical protein